MKITLIDLGAGNIKSLSNALKYLGANFEVSNDIKRIQSSSHLIIGGVSSFDTYMEAIENLSLKKIILDLVIKKKIPLLGICSGFQILFNNSQEGTKQGLGIVNGNITKLSYSKNKKYNVPNVGFKKTYGFKNNVLFKNLSEMPHFYFTHSYALEKSKIKKFDNICYSDHSKTIIAGIQIENICGVQFHPEKSQENGLCILYNFLKNS